MTDRLGHTSRFVVLGEGLAAGVGHFSLSEEIQPWSFPALVARQLEIPFRQPELEAPGVGNAGNRQLPVILPDLLQTSVRKDFPGTEHALNNLSVPGLTARDARTLRAKSPLVHRRDAKQTLINFILGLPGLAHGETDLPTQLEAAVRLKPTFALVALGYYEILELCVQGYQHSGERMDLPTFEEDYDAILKSLAKTGATIVAATIPDPLDTAYFSTLSTAATILRTEPDFLRQTYNLRADDRITVPGLVDIGYQMTARQITGTIEEGGVLSAADASKIWRAVERLNAIIRKLADNHGAKVYDLGGFLKRVALDGASVGARRFTNTFLDGFYLLNGVYPGRTGHALIANDLLTFLNRELGTIVESVDVAEILADDGNALAQLSTGQTATDAFLKPRTRADIPRMQPADPSMINVFPPFDPNKFNLFPIQTIYPELDPSGRKTSCNGVGTGVPAGGFSEPRLKKALKLPPGLEQTLPLNKDWSYFGDALRAVDAPHDKPFLPAFPSFGASGNTFFGGFAMTDSHLQGQLNIKFSEPDVRNVSRFEMYHPGGLVGDDGVLAAPLFFKLPSQLNSIGDVPGLASSGELNLNTGVVSNFHYRVFFMNTAILALFGVNPKLPAGPMVFPGPPNAGSTWGRFEQREDGLLDFTGAANMFLPLGITFGGEMIRFPLPFSTPDLQCASIAMRCLSLHPHIHISTKPSTDPVPGRVPQIPVNTVEDYAVFTHNTTFGDVFGLHVEELGGEGTGRCHLMGRLKIQFGPRFGNSVSFLLQVLPPGGLCAPYPTPLPYLPPGTARGMIGFNEQMVFPSGVTYNQTKLSAASDPFRVAVGAIDLRTGRVIGEFLHPGFVVQQLFVNLIDVEPCTPADTFNYQGDAVFEAGPHGETIFRFNGETLIPYPRGLHFPAPTPDGHPSFFVFRDSRLDPFVRYRAMSGGAPGRGVFEGGEDNVRSSIGREFSYRYSLPLDPAEPGARFEYTNHTEGGTFTLTSLTWFVPTYSRGESCAPGETDTVTFGGFGRWSNDEEVHQVSVHISTAEGARYVGIQVDGGVTSNVNTKPKDIRVTMP